MKKSRLALIGLAIMGATSIQVTSATTLYESSDVLTPGQALGRYQWMQKCYPGMLLEIHDQIFDPTVLIPNDEKLANLREALLYSKGQLRSDANYLTFGDENNENPVGWYAGKSINDNCFAIPSDYRISAVLVASKLPSYCQPKSKDTEYEYIRKVSLSGVVNESKASPYSNYVGKTMELVKETPATIELTPGYTIEGDSYYETFHVYVDWNQDGKFSGKNEIHQVGATKTTLTYTLTPPADAKSGLTKMRVSMDYYGGYPNACTDIRTGEFEDYILYIK